MKIKKESSFLTQADLRALDFSEYLIGEICKSLDFVRLERGVKGYKPSDLKGAIEKKLSQPKTKSKTRENLRAALNIIDKQYNNVIEVDFLRKLSSEERIDFLKSYREKLRVKGDALLKDVDELLMQAKTLV